MKALIIGGGIAGPVTAMALQKAGIEAVVYEAYAASAGLDAGSYLTVAVNGLDALRAIDLHEAVMAAGFPSESISMFSGSGKPLGVVPIGGKLADGTVTHTIRRSDLYRIVHDEATNRGIRIGHGKRLVDAESTASGVTAIFADSSRASGDLMIGRMASIPACGASLTRLLRHLITPVLAISGDSRMLHRSVLLPASMP
jgi:2-polyprenyl-6-methoxyphenol hydroxylase-like FAD-dependent oxidoreductase